MCDVNTRIENSNNRALVADNRLVPQRVDIESAYAPLLRVKRILPRVGTNHTGFSLAAIFARRNDRRSHRQPLGHSAGYVHTVVRLGPLHLVERRERLHKHSHRVGALRHYLHMKYLVEIVLLHCGAIHSLNLA